MSLKHGRFPDGSGSRPADRAASAGVSPVPASIPNAVVAVIADLNQRFGPGMSNGVAAILLHRDLPGRFSRKNWADWVFRPSVGAFEWAHHRGLITPWGRTKKWAFTELGFAVAEQMQAASAIEAGTVETEGLDAQHESAVAKPDAPPQVPHA
jgi:hypothetical protein